MVPSNCGLGSNEYQSIWVRGSGVKGRGNTSPAAMKSKQPGRGHIRRSESDVRVQQDQDATGHVRRRFCDALYKEARCDPKGSRAFLPNQVRCPPMVKLQEPKGPKGCMTRAWTAKKHAVSPWPSDRDTCPWLATLAEKNAAGQATPTCPHALRRSASTRTCCSSLALALALAPSLSLSQTSLATSIGTSTRDEPLSRCMCPARPTN